LVKTAVELQQLVAAAVELVPDQVHRLAADMEVAACQRTGQMDADSGRRVELHGLVGTVPGHLVQHHHHIGAAEHHIVEAGLHTVVVVVHHRPVDLRREVDIVELLAKETGV